MIKRGIGVLRFDFTGLGARISIAGDIRDEERQKIFEIAERCPVHRTITSGVIIKAELAD